MKQRLVKKNLDKKISLILLIIMIFNIVFPNYSNADVLSSVLTKPLATLIVIGIDNINILLSFTFALDAKATDGSDAMLAYNNNGSGDQSFFEKMQNGLNESQAVWGNVLLSPEDIFEGKVKIADANIFTSNNTGNRTSFGNLIGAIKEAVAEIYYIMRNLGATILLCLLIYCGIRIVLSSANAGEKAKWKMYLFDWLKALILVMFVHVLMIGVFYIAETICDGLSSVFTPGGTLVSEIRMGYFDSGSFDFSSTLIYIGIYAYVTYLNIIFLIAYFKRFLFVMLMIIIAPVISALYALGKVGKPLFNNWVKEFTFGVLVQPFHLLIYTVLLLMPIKIMQSSTSNPGTVWSYASLDVKLYAIFSLSSIRPLEKYMRRIFGFGHTQLDNMASYESGKKTVDKVKQAVKQTVETVAKVGLAVASGGATAAIGGATAAAQGATAAAQDAKALDRGAQGEEFLSPELAKEGLLLYMEDQALLDLTPDPNNMGDWTDADEQALNELYEEQIQRRDDYEARKEEYLENKSAGENIENKSAGENIESKADGQNIILNNANVQIQADSLEGLETDAIESTTLNSENLKDAIQESTSGTNGDDALGTANGNGKIKLGDYLALALQSTMDGMDNVKGKVNERKEQFEEKHPKLAAINEASKATVQVLKSPDIQNSIQDLKSAFHELGDTMFMPGDADPSLWKTDIDYKKTIIKKNEEKLMASFVNDKENQNKVIQGYNLKDKIDKKTGEVKKSKEDQAKEKLKEMMPYASVGITDVGKIMQLQSKGYDRDSSMKQYVRDNIRNNIQERAATTRVQKFNTTNNIQVMRTIAANKMNIPPERRSEPKIIQQITQQVNQDIKEGAKYITSGAAKDPETLHRLMDLEKKLDKRIDSTGTSGAIKVQAVSNADKIVEKALQKKMKEIKVTGADKNTGLKELQKILNDALEERRNATVEKEIKTVKEVKSSDTKSE